MKNKILKSQTHQNRRNFLKSNIIFGLGTLTMGTVIPQSCTSLKKPDISGVITRVELLKKYQESLGGPFPEPTPLNPVLREIIQKDGYRIESVTYEGFPGERIQALILIPDGINSSNPAPGIAVWHQHNGEYHLGKSEPGGKRYRKPH